MSELRPTVMDPGTAIDPSGMPVASPMEEARLRALARYAILDTQPDAAFDDLRCLAQRVSDSSLGAIAFFDRDRVWFKSLAGLDLTQCPRDAILEPGSTTVKARPALRGRTALRGSRVAAVPVPSAIGASASCRPRTVGSLRRRGPCRRGTAG